MHEDIFAGLTLDEPVTLRSIKPLHCSLFLHLHYLIIRIALPLLVQGLAPREANYAPPPSAGLPPRPQKKGASVSSQPPRTSQKVIQEQQMLGINYHKMENLSTWNHRSHPFLNLR